MILMFSSVYAFLKGVEGEKTLLNQVESLARANAVRELETGNLSLLAESYMGAGLKFIPGLDKDKYLNCLSPFISVRYYKDNADLEPADTILETYAELEDRPETSYHYALAFNAAKLEVIGEHPRAGCI
ncbi:hypothetical protein KUV95_17305 [Microbulbifer agarilyticus]|uniref:hypothetical protein n=1 Tax=Microbulbifer agarilyticus TaxID=260552 RepID=UPI001C959875|nr:hypothetical protein [Microbulbifer agarilyticus]MBY6213302.1 hypothetical protein [Microbulbifer agarilyticus]